MITRQLLNVDRVTGVPFTSILIGFQSFSESIVSVSITVNKSSMKTKPATRYVNSVILTSN
jgi:hypothetical protein